MALPVRTISRPAVLAGQLNGRLDASVLRSTPSAARLHEPAMRKWKALTAGAADAGHTLKPSCLYCSYRPYAEQVRIFLDRFTTTPVSNIKRYWRGETWYLKPGNALAAVPGTSNHGWAGAVDTGEERDGDTGTESMDDATLGWLLDGNALRFGWCWEVQSEPWHLVDFMGDTIPAAVLAYERSEDELWIPDMEDAMAGGAVFKFLRSDGKVGGTQQMLGARLIGVTGVRNVEAARVLAAQENVPTFDATHHAKIKTAVNELRGALGLKPQ